MALPRVAFPLVLQSPSTGSALVGASATITKHVVGGALGSGEAATIYTEETGAGKTASNTILTDNTGRWTAGSSEGYKQYWLEEGRYDILISGTGLTSVYITRESVTSGYLLIKTSGSESPITAGAGEFLEMTGFSARVRLPTGSATNTIVGTFNIGGETSLETTGGEHIIGRGEGSSETSISISINQYVIVRYDGTRWLIVGGVPNEYVGKAQIRVESITDTKIVKGRTLVNTENKLVETKPSIAEVHTGIKPSNNKVALVKIFVVGGSEASNLEVEGKTAGLLKGSASETAIVPAGAVWKSFAEMSGVSGFIVQTLLLG